MDPIWCIVLDNSIGDLMTASTLTFWGCDFAFFGTLEWLTTSYDSPLTAHKEKDDISKIKVQ